MLLKSAISWLVGRECHLSPRQTAFLKGQRAIPRQWQPLSKTNKEPLDPDFRTGLFVVVWTCVDPGLHACNLNQQAKAKITQVHPENPTPLN